MDIRTDDLSGAAIAAFQEQHLQDMRVTSPPESKHALDLNGLRDPSVTFWTLWLGERIAACAAIQVLDADHVELKSMRTAHDLRGQGFASALLGHAIKQARARGHRRISLETGTRAFFAPARAMYQRHGFVDCTHFGNHRPDPNCVFMTMGL